VSSLRWSGLRCGESEGTREGNGVGDTHTQRGIESRRAGYSISFHYLFPSFPHSLHVYCTYPLSRYHLLQMLSRTLALRAPHPLPRLPSPMLASLARDDSLTRSIRPHHRPRPSNSLRPHRSLRIPLFPRCRSLPPPSAPTRIRFLDRHAPR